jgi:hypothetical protein
MGGKTRADARTGAMPNDDACTGRTSSHDMCTGSMPTPNVGGRNVPSAAVSTATVSTATMSTAAAVSSGSACGDRYAAKRENCGQRKDWFARHVLLPLSARIFLRAPYGKT